MNFIKKIVETVKYPKNAMKRISEKPMIEEAVMIVGIYAILSALLAYFLRINKISQISGNMSDSIQQFFIIYLIVVGVIAPFVGWFISSGIIHFISMALSGEGKFYPQLITVAGYSMIPQIFGAIINLALFLLIQPATIEMDLTNSYYSSSNIINIIMKIWAAAILIFGVQSVHKLTFKKSALAVGIPLLASFALAAIGLWWSRSIS